MCFAAPKNSLRYQLLSSFTYEQTKAKAQTDILLDLWFGIQLARKSLLKGLTTSVKNQALPSIHGLENQVETSHFHLPFSLLMRFSHLISIRCLLFMLPFQAQILTLLRALIKSRRQQDWTESLQYLVPRLSTHKAGAWESSLCCLRLWGSLWIFSASGLVVFLWHLKYLSLDPCFSQKSIL